MYWNNNTCTVSMVVSLDASDWKAPWKFSQFYHTTRPTFQPTDYSFPFTLIENRIIDKVETVLLSDNYILMTYTYDKNSQFKRTAMKLLRINTKPIGIAINQKLSINKYFVTDTLVGE